MQQDFKNVSWFDAALKTTREILKSRIISSDNDQLAVVFYGTVGPCYGLPAPGTVAVPHFKACTIYFLLHAERKPEQQCL